MASGVKRKRVVLSLKQKLDIINRLDKGEKVTALSKEYNVGKSSVMDIKMSKDSILKYVSSFANAENMNQRKTMKTSYNKELDQSVFEWYVNMTKNGHTLTGPAICDKALELNNNLGGSSDFKASFGWLKNFKYRHGIGLGSGNSPDIQSIGNCSVDKTSTSSEDGTLMRTIVSDDASEITPRVKRKRVVLSFRDKLDIITRLDNGEAAACLAREYNVGQSSVKDIKMNQDAILNYVSSFASADNMYRRKTMKSAFNKELDQAVYEWYLETVRNGQPISGPLICDKALELNTVFGGAPEFKASSGWLQNFKSRHGLLFQMNDTTIDNVYDLNPENLCPDIYSGNGNSDFSSGHDNGHIYFSSENNDGHIDFSSGHDNGNSYQNHDCLPSCDVILNVPDENDASEKDMAKQGSSTTGDSDLLLAFDTVLGWVKNQKECSSTDVLSLLKLRDLACVKGMSVAFSSDGSEPINRKIEQVDTEKRNESISVESMYEIDRCSEWIKSNSFSKIALQFPDSMLSDAATVALKLGEITDQQIFVLGDTSFGSCCVDEISAEHVSANAIIHFGHSCLSPTKRLPVLYVFGKQIIEVQDAADAFKRIFPDSKSHVVLLYEVMYSYAIDSIVEKLQEYENLIISLLEIPGEDTKNFNVLDVHKNSIPIIKCHRHIQIPTKKTLNDYRMFYIGSRTVTLTNFMLTFKNNFFYSYNPSVKLSRAETLDVNKHLRKRYYYIEKAKDANIIGILVGTVGVSEYMTIIKHLKELIKQAGKRSYTLVVGKLNNAKLANFSEIEIFVNVACAEASLVESREFYQSIVTPYELEIALNQAREWTGDYIVDFAELLPGAANYMPPIQSSEIQSDVSLVTGKIRQVGLPTSSEAESDSSTTLVTRNEMTMSAVHSRAAGEFLAQRSWQGLEQQLGETPVPDIEEGQRGIASGYEDEKH